VSDYSKFSHLQDPRGQQALAVGAECIGGPQDGDRLPCPLWVRRGYNGGAYHLDCTGRTWYYRWVAE
jgi:hypothetical protein